MVRYGMIRQLGRMPAYYDEDDLNALEIPRTAEEQWAGPSLYWDTAIRRKKWPWLGGRPREDVTDEAVSAEKASRWLYNKQLRPKGLQYVRTLGFGSGGVCCLFDARDKEDPRDPTANKTFYVAKCVIIDPDTPEYLKESRKEQLHNEMHVMKVR